MTAGKTYDPDIIGACFARALSTEDAAVLEAAKAILQKKYGNYHVLAAAHDYHAAKMKVPEPDIHGEGEPDDEAAADAVDKADERERRIVAAKEAVVEKARRIGVAVDEATLRIATLLPLSLCNAVGDLRVALEALDAAIAPPDPAVELRKVAEVAAKLLDAWKNPGAADRLRKAVAAFRAQNKEPT